MNKLLLCVLVWCLWGMGVCVANVSQQDSQDNEDQHLITVELDRPTYILPYYYTQTPYQEVYAGNTPDNQRVKNNEFKAQISLKIPVAHNIFNTHTSLTFAYTQLMYWQLYTDSPYFRETNYEPELYLSHNINRNWQARLGAVHESNGRGGDLERSWNRAYIDGIYHTNHFYVSVKPWVLLLTKHSSGLHNADITRYLGYGRWLVAYQYHKFIIAFMSRNNFESGFKRGAETLTLSYPFYKNIRLFVQGFSGYGQSLIEYDHYTNGVGIGVSLNDWL